MPNAEERTTRSSAPAVVARGGGEGVRVLIAGSGVAGIETALALRDLAGDRVEIDVLAPRPALHYWPLAVTEPFGAPRVEDLPLASIFERHGVRFRPGSLAAVDPDRRIARTGSGEALRYDALVIACGGTHVEGVAGAITFPGLGAAEDLRSLLDDVARGQARRVVFALPSGAGWPPALYELAVMAASELERRGEGRAELALVTPESEPLGVFGRRASRELGRLLAAGGIELVAQTYPVSVEAGGLAVRPGGLLPADRVVALARLEGPRIEGVPHDASGFVPVDAYGAVVGLEDVLAAGDAVAFPLKQGGIAAQQADVVARVTAARAGAPVAPVPFRPVLRGILLTGGRPRYLRSEVVGGYGDDSIVSLEPLWWPPAKIAGRYLASALAEVVGQEPHPRPAPGPDDVEVDLVPAVESESGR